MEKSYELDGIHVYLEICEGVYEPSEDTFLLAKTVKASGRNIEIGSGSGFISIYLAKIGYEIECTDINEKAVECIIRNQKRNGVKFPCKRSDLFSDISGIYDTIIFNPPYLPTSDRINGSEQWDGGDDGFHVIRKFLLESEKHLSENGSIFIILSSLTNIDMLMSEFEKYSFTFKVMGEEHFFFETIYSYELKRSG
ncbi:HemK2/MTQ2 family protein methyltransferase [Cuniculiplasma sp. SKW3]|uniref:HemK2/MTQ2 family protein methyltransferase n=1 Tax=Cuniculiplasma sp. SKW3 TaxID=3400170 RepID=UPI003FD2E4AB